MVNMFINLADGPLNWSGRLWDGLPYSSFQRGRSEVIVDFNSIHSAAKGCIETQIIMSRTGLGWGDGKPSTT